MTSNCTQYGMAPESEHSISLYGNPNGAVKIKTERIPVTKVPSTRTWERSGDHSTLPETYTGFVHLSVSLIIVYFVGCLGGDHGWQGGGY